MITDEMLLYFVINAFDVEIIRRSMQVFLNNPRNKVLCVCSYILYYVSAFFSHSIDNVVVGIIINIITIGYVAFQHEGKAKRKFISGAFTFSLMCLCEFVAGNVFDGDFKGLLLNLNVSNLYALITSKLLNFMLVLIIGRIWKNNSRVARIGIDWSAVSLIPISTAVLETAVISSAQSAVTVILSVVIVLFLNVIVFYLFDKLAENYNNKLELARVEREKEIYYEQCVVIMKSQESLRQFRHDINNQLEMISLLTDNGNIAELKEQVHDLISSTSVDDFCCLTGNVTVDGILNYKLKKLKQLDVEVETDLEIPRQKFMNTKDLTIILGNLLDNAIEALSLMQTNKYCYVQIKYSKGCLIVNLKNTYKNPVIYKNGSIESSKADSDLHGIGLRSVKDVVNKYNGQIDISHNDRFFSVKTILLPVLENSED